MDFDGPVDPPRPAFAETRPFVAWCPCGVMGVVLPGERRPRGWAVTPAGAWRCRWCDPASNLPWAECVACAVPHGYCGRDPRVVWVEMERLGWVMVSGAWRCAYCSGRGSVAEAERARAREREKRRKDADRITGKADDGEFDDGSGEDWKAGAP